LQLFASLLVAGVRSLYLEHFAAKSIVLYFSYCCNNLKILNLLSYSSIVYFLSYKNIYKYDHCSNILKAGKVESTKTAKIFERENWYLYDKFVYDINCSIFQFIFTTQSETEVWFRRGYKIQTFWWTLPALSIKCFSCSINKSKFLFFTQILTEGCTVGEKNNSTESRLFSMFRFRK